MMGKIYRNNVVTRMVTILYQIQVTNIPGTLLKEGLFYPLLPNLTKTPCRDRQ